MKMQFCYRPLLLACLLPALIPAILLPAAALGGAGCDVYNSRGEKILALAHQGGRSFHDGLMAVPDGHGLWGYVDGDGKQVVEPRFEAADDFSEGLAAVMEKGLWGFIDKRDGMVIQHIFDEVGSFREGICPVRENGRYGYISRDGSFLISPGDWSEASLFEGDAAAVLSNNQWAIIDSSGELVLAPQFDEEPRPLRSLQKGCPPRPEGACFVYRGGKKGVVGKGAKMLIPAEYDRISLQNGFFLLEKAGRKGVADYTGRIIVPLSYDKCEYLGEGAWQGCRVPE